MSDAWLEKAGRAIAAARLDLEASNADFAASRAYYAMFYIAQALLASRHTSFGKHSSVHAAYGLHFAKTNDLEPKFHRWLLEAFADRIEGDYVAEAKFDTVEVSLTVERAVEFLEAARTWLHENA